MSIEIKSFFLLTIAFIINLCLISYQGVSATELFTIAENSKKALIMVPFLILSYHIIFFVLISSIGIYKGGFSYFSNMEFSIKKLIIEFKKSILFSILFVYLIIFQTSFKLIFAWKLQTPNSIDWLLYTFDRVFTGPSLWWWGNTLLPNYIWVKLIVFLDRFYMPYFAYQWFIVMYIIFHEQDNEKKYFITMFFLIWIFGTTLGGLCQSGGPFFFSYAPWNLIQTKELLLIHKITPLLSLQTQDYLWQSYLNKNEIFLAGGISAFPSLHIAMSVYVYLYAKTTRNILFIYFTMAGLALTWIGSILLGWHYLVDGFGAIFIVYLAYKTSIVLHKF